MTDLSVLEKLRQPQGLGLPPVAPRPAACQSAPLHVSWARHLDEVRAAQRLRYQVFALEMGARLPQTLPGHDIDLFDDFCEHLLVRDAASEQVIGTYRVLTPTQAKRVGGFYSETEFDLTRLRLLREQMVELGRSCVHPEHRHGGVILALWSALGEFMTRNRLHTMIGCASIPMTPESGGGHAAASIWQQLSPSTWLRSSFMCARACRCRSSASIPPWSSNRRRSSKAICAWAPRCWARRPGTRTSTPPTCR